MNLHDIVKKGSTDRSVTLRIIDDTDGTPETGVVFNTSGIDLWYRREGAAVSSVTEATLAALTTAHSDGGFLHISDGEYRLDLPDAAFATGAEYVDFGGTVTGMIVLGGRVRLVDIDLEDTVRAGLTALPNAAADAAGGLPISDAGGLDVDAIKTTTDKFVFTVANQVDANALAISGDTTAADNLELQYDGTGLTGDTFPATQSALGRLTSGSAAIATTAASVTVTTGTEVNAYTDTTELNGTVHEVNPSVGSTEFYYEFDVGGNGVPVSITWEGYANSNGDSYTVKAYNWGTTTFEQVDTITGANGSTVVSIESQLTNAHVGTGANIGKVRWQITSADGTGFNTDRIICHYAVVAQSTGYALGRIWINTVSGTAGTEVGVNGIYENPVDSIADAVTLAAALNSQDFHVSSDSTLTLAANLQNYNVYGIGYTLDFAGFDCSGTHFFHASPVDGIVLSGGSDHVDILDSIINDVTVNDSHFTNCSMTGTITLGSVASTVRLIGCRSVIAGASTPILDCGTALGVNHNITIADWQNGIEIRNLNNNGTDLFSMSGTGQVVFAASCSGSVNLRGNWKVTNTGGVTITYDDNSQNLIDVLADTAEIGTAGAGLTDLGGMSTTMKAQVNAEADTALADYDGPTNAEMEARTPTAAQLAYIVANAATGMPVTFTTSGGSTTAAVLNQVDGASGSATDDQYNGRLLVFTNGTLKGVVTDITDYDGGTTTATITAIPFAPTASHTARLI